MEKQKEKDEKFDLTMTDANRIMSNGGSQNSTSDDSDSAGGSAKLHTCYMLSS